MLTLQINLLTLDSYSSTQLGSPLSASLQTNRRTGRCVGCFSSTIKKIKEMKFNDTKDKSKKIGLKRSVTYISYGYQWRELNKENLHFKTPNHLFIDSQSSLSRQDRRF